MCFLTVIFLLNVVCSDKIIISYPDYYVSLKHLSQSVKPGGKLVNTVAEIGIYALNETKGKVPVKQILPLRIAVRIPLFPFFYCFFLFLLLNTCFSFSQSYLQDGILDNREVDIAFQRSPCHLDRFQLVIRQLYYVN